MRVYEPRAQTDFSFKNSEISLSLSLLVYSFLYLTVQNGVNDYSMSPLTAFKEKMKERTNKRIEKKWIGRLLGREKKEAVSCGWHPDRLVWVRNGFPEAPERSRQCHYGNATA